MNSEAIVQACRKVPSPALLVLPELVRSNIARMIAMTRSPARLRPHLKTTKMPKVVQLLLDVGITQFKCATLSEMHMALEAGARDVLLAYQPAGPNIQIFFDLCRAWPEANLSTVVDCEAIAQQLAHGNDTVEVYIDVNCGMHRTGILPGENAIALFRKIQDHENLLFQGWHVYDGHLHQSSLTDRQAAVTECFEPVWEMLAATDPKATVVAGGTPTFPIHAQDPRVICSPGTCVFWDAGYANKVPDMTFDWAAVLLTRIISKPDSQHLTLDLGHKAVASENPLEHRVVFPAIPDAVFVSQSEEHLVIRTDKATEWSVGDTLLGIPWHVCPTVALYDRATTIIDDHVHDIWEIPARRRDIPASLP
ncbi:MAG: D-serine deaminase-like pyridoxal phosphate-dependent protein [Verrucomicrobiales bacterium]|jgi:D-serine deaminase-like pyridoxal phosphate-dependent protein